MSKEEQRILVVPQEAIFGRNNEYFFEGFSHAHLLDYESRILKNLQVMRRGNPSENPSDHVDGSAEADPRFKQPIGYAIVYNPKEKKVFAYQRSSNKKDHEEHRMLGNWSWGFGGHVEPRDGSNNPIKDGMIRETTQEEIKIYGNIKEPKVLGYIYHNYGVNAVHFGILYAIETNATRVEPKDPEISRVETKTLSELKEMSKLAMFERKNKNPSLKIDAWSMTALEPLDEILGNN